MLRNIIEKEGKFALGGFKTAATGTFKSGMGVAKTESTKIAALPSAEAGTDILVLNNKQFVSGAKAAFENLSDYDDGFCAFANGEQCGLCNFDAFEKFATDQFDATTLIADNAGKRCTVGTDGKWKVGTASVNSYYIFVGLITDAGHTLALIERAESVGANS